MKTETKNMIKHETEQILKIIDQIGGTDQMDDIRRAIDIHTVNINRILGNIPVNPDTQDYDKKVIEEC